jgi:hypothetical protein
MDQKSAEIIAFFITYVVGGIVLGVIAAFKNRNYWAWGLVGGLFWIPCIIALAMLPHLCPKCERPLTPGEWKRRHCPTCSTTNSGPAYEDESYALLAKATKLEAQGSARQALVAYAKVTETFPGSTAANDAQKSLESLRERLG